MDDRQSSGFPGFPTTASAGEQRVSGFFDALKTKRKLEEEARNPISRGDALVQARLKEISAYVDVFLKEEALRRPRFSLLEVQADPKAATRVSVEFRDAVQFYEGLALSLSSGGIFIKTESLLPIDSLLDMEIKLRTEGIVIRVMGKVIWVNPREAQGRPAGLGVKFPKLSSIQRQIITDFMNGEIEIVALGHLSE
ncbi:MAG: hypothetical protein GXP54_10275 [Deltaproteobacteria bacterium]|nr:hypothetical protein [Deltaproteobacteria bacterium]